MPRSQTHWYRQRKVLVTMKHIWYSLEVHMLLTMLFYKSIFIVDVVVYKVRTVLSQVKQYEMLKPYLLWFILYDKGLRLCLSKTMPTPRLLMRNGFYGNSFGQTKTSSIELPYVDIHSMDLFSIQTYIEDIVRAWSMHLHTLSGDWRVRLEFQCSDINLFTNHLLFSNAALNLVSYILLMHIPKVKSINNNIFQSHYKISWDTIICMYQDNNTRPIRKRKFADWFRKETHSNKDLWGYIIMCSKYDIQRI